MITYSITALIIFLMVRKDSSMDWNLTGKIVASLFWPIFLALVIWLWLDGGFDH